MKVLVLGGAGYIGSQAVRALSARGHQVWVYDNLSMGHRQSVPSNQLIIGDLADQALLDHTLLLHQIEAVMHFAAFAYVGESVHHPDKYYQNNVVNTLHLFDALKRHHIRKIVFSSSCATYGIPATIPITEETQQHPINPYGRTKLIIEQALADYAQAYGWSYAALRYFNASGASADGSLGEDHTPETHLIPLVFHAIQGKIPYLEIFGDDYPTPDGTCIRDYIHVEDLASAHVLALEKLADRTHLKLNLGIGQGYSVKKVIETVEKITGKKVPIRISPRRAGDPPELIAAPAKAIRELNWKPRYIDLESIIETAWRWHRDHPNGYGKMSKS